MKDCSGKNCIDLNAMLPMFNSSWKPESKSILIHFEPDPHILLFSDVAVKKEVNKNLTTIYYHICYTLSFSDMVAAAADLGASNRCLLF